MKGFTLIEIVICIAIVGVLTSIVVTKFSDAGVSKEQSGIVESIVSQLQKQQAQSQAGKDGSNYGIKFNHDSYVLFTGTAYSQSSTSNTVVPVSSKFVLTETISNSDNVIYFSKILGNANESATVTVSHVSNKVSPKTIQIDKTGTISVIE